MTSDGSLQDQFGRAITYVRLSVTDRCDLRCGYCMSERMTFLPKRDLLTLEELERMSDAFIRRGVKKIRITGGEPLVRRDVTTLIARLGERLGDGSLSELTVTTNATQLETHAGALAAAGVRRVNVSLDTLDPEKFHRLTRRDAFDAVMRGLDAAQAAGIAIKINIVALRAFNRDEIPDMIAWAHGRGMQATLIEVMPLGDVEADRVDQFLPLSVVREDLERRWTLSPLAVKTGGPARYHRIEETGGVLGLITPLTNNFCAGCNRVRVTCTGQIYMCLGHGDNLDLRAALRGPDPERDLNAALDRAMLRKPERHHFDIAERGAAPAVARHMSVTGG
ncbi:MAG: GTP 3',8-cyclase MoaA [Pseudomonadota bacterium]